MSEAEKKGSSSAGLKEKNLLLDMDIGTDFFGSWNSKSKAEGDGMDFDLPQFSKGNKKSFDFSKLDMDFNLDGDFGKISSFNIDMPDIDISPPLKKDGKSKEKSNESSIGKDKGERDRFDFGFDFAEIGNFDFGPSLTKKDSRSQREKDNKDSSPDENTYEDKEGSARMDKIGTMDTSENGLQKPSLSENDFNLDFNCLVGRGKDVENPTKNLPLKMTVNDAITSVNSAAIDELTSDGRNDPPRTTITSRELPKTNQSEKLISAELVDADTCAGNDAELDLSSDYLPNNELNISSKAQEKVDCIGTKVTDSDIRQDVHSPSVEGLSCNNKCMMPEKLQHLQPVSVTEKNSCDENEVEITETVMDDKEITEAGQVNSVVEKQCTRNPLSGIPFKMPSAGENLETASEIPKLPLASEPNGQSEKEAAKTREPLVSCLKSLIQSEKLECPVQKLETPSAFPLSSNKKMDSAEPSRVEGRESDGIQSARKLVSLPIQLSSSKTLLKMDIPPTQSQENYKGLNTSRECNGDGLKDGKQPPDSFTTQNKDLVKAKSSLKQREMSRRSLDSPSSTMEISNKSLLQNSCNPKNLSSVPTTKSTPAAEQKLSSIQSGKKPPELHALKFPSLNLDSAKSPLLKDAKSGGNVSQTRTLLRKPPSDTTHFPDSQKQVPCCLPVKRKTLEDDVDALHPSKHPCHSLTGSRYLAKTSEIVHAKEVPNYTKRGDSIIKIATENCQVSALQIPHDDKIRFEVMSCNADTDSNIKLAKAYEKELNDLCNKLRKMQYEGKELLVRVTVNSNKLLMLNNPVLDEKIRATGKLLARLTLDSPQG